MNKYIEFLLTKLKTYIKQSEINSEGYQLNYIFEAEPDSKDLIIIFSGFTRVGVKARYNYNKTLKNIKANKLFILDDFGYDKRGAYYLGKDMDFKVQKVVKKLITKIQVDLEIKKSIYTGTSKGGYAALFFGLQEKNSYIISGAPQYYLGSYLSGNESNKENCLKYIVGKEVTQKKIDLLNKLLPDLIMKCSENNNMIKLFYSDVEHTYRNHIIYLIQDFTKFNYKFNLEVGHYKDHNDISIYFPDFLVKSINEII